MLVLSRSIPVLHPYYFGEELARREWTAGESNVESGFIFVCRSCAVTCCAHSHCRVVVSPGAAVSWCHITCLSPPLCCLPIQSYCPLLLPHRRLCHRWPTRGKYWRGFQAGIGAASSLQYSPAHLYIPQCCKSHRLEQALVLYL